MTYYLTGHNHLWYYKIQDTEGEMRDVAQQDSYQFKLQEIREYKVVKANELIQRSRYNLSTQEQKIILYLITKIRPDDSALMLYEFKVKEFCEICGIDQKSGKNYHSLKATIKRLADKSLWTTIDEKGTETLIRWIERPYVNANSGTIKIKLDELMRPYLLQLKERFTQYCLYYTLAMRSQYSVRLYEILKSYENIGGWTFEVDDLKRKLFAETYDRYPDFKRKVIDIAIREINDFGDIFVTYTVKKQGKKVSHLVFAINPKVDIDDRLNTWIRIDDVLQINQ